MKSFEREKSPLNEFIIAEISFQLEFVKAFNPFSPTIFFICYNFPQDNTVQISGDKTSHAVQQHLALGLY